MTTKRQVTIDVRTDIGAGQTPCDRILQAAEQLQEGEELQILAPFKPTPLVDRLAQVGLVATLTERVPGEWQLLAHRTSATASQRPTAAASSEPHACPTPERTQELDVRGLLPPEPLQRTLEALTDLPEDTVLATRTDRQPAHLFAQLEKRGFLAASEEQTDGSWINRIWRK